MHITMIKKRLVDGSECRKCVDATAYLRERNLWDRIDEILWADEGDPESAGMVLGGMLGIDRAPFFIVRDDAGEKVYASVLQLVRERMDTAVTVQEQAAEIDPDDIGGI